MFLLYLFAIVNFVLFVPCVTANRVSLCDEHFEFECGEDSETKCIPKQLKCNNLKDCSNGADESGCVYPVQCPSTSLLCANGHCLDQSYRCNDVDECRDGSDEVGCTFHQPIWCPSNKFHCKLGPCIDKSHRCDGHTDCPHGDDENDCPILPLNFCKLNEYRCESTNRCIPITWVCDGMMECTDNSDEKYCVRGKLLPNRNNNKVSISCKKDQIACRKDDGHICVERSQLCDGKADCDDGTDEGQLCNQCAFFNCQQQCTENTNGPICSCYDGMSLMSDGRSCVDVDECVDGTSKCDHYCHNTMRSYHCSCAPHYISVGHQCRFVRRA